MKTYQILVYLIFGLALTTHFQVLSHNISKKPQLQLAKRYHSGINIQDYWVSEKLDGVRAFWDGKQLYTRGGKVIAAPNWFIQDFPSIALDGELWIDRGKFELVSGIVRRKVADDVAWQQVRFMIFDLPSSPLSFSEVVAQMQRVVAKVNSPYLAMIKQRRVMDNQQLQAYLDRVIALGGEGLMLHRADANYQVGRNDNVLKLKRHQDAEAEVIAHLAGKGKYTGMMGAIRVRDKNGIEFNIGSGFSDKLRKHPPDIGAIVTFKFYGKTSKNVPRFASFLRIRPNED